MTQTALAAWLDRIQRQHPRAIALGLDRVREVALRMQLRRPARKVITIGGTNGKGSTVAYVEAIARAAGWRVGAYTSPHLLAYNERVRIDGQDADDAALVAAFEAVEAATAGTALTYFEYGTLAALWLFQQAGLDLAILEVGLGGRLDAVNLIDADVAVVTTVDLDHQDWLGEDRESIGREKAGIARAGKPLVIGDDDPPTSVLAHAYAIGASAIRAGCDYLVAMDDDGSWSWREVGFVLRLPAPGIAGTAQVRNAAAAIAAVRALRTPIRRDAYARGIGAARVPARLQQFDDRGVTVLVDVAHNPQAAAELSRWLQHAPVAGRTLAVFSALGDKDLVGLVTAVAPGVDAWFLAGLADAGPRGLTVDAVAERLIHTPASHGDRYADVAQALAAARAQAAPSDRIVVFGSFHTAATALQVLQRDGAGPG